MTVDFYETSHCSCCFPGTV